MPERVPTVGDLTRTLQGIREGLSVLGEAVEMAGAGKTAIPVPPDGLKVGVCIRVLICALASGCDPQSLDITVHQLIDALGQHVEACRVLAGGLDPEMELPFSEAT